MKELKRGFTTGSCLTATVIAGFESLLSNKKINSVSFRTPSDEKLNLKVILDKKSENSVKYGIKKYSGDDPDVTNGAFIYSTVEIIDKDTYNSIGKEKHKIILNDFAIISVVKGVGIVTKAGLACNIGEPAINPTPRKMVKDAIENLANIYDFKEYIHIKVDIPQGEELAKKTFNKTLGIIGGISILGTTGIVEPMSEQALIDTIEVEMKVCKATGSDIVVITPGNYGKDYIRKETDISDEITVKCSNFIGDSLEFARLFGFDKVVLSGHLGKLIKVAGGILNTHSKYGDHRMEIIRDILIDMEYDALGEKILECVMVDDAIRIIDEFGIKKEFMNKVVDRVYLTMNSILNKENKTVEIGVIIFSNKYGLLGENKNISKWFG